MSLRLTFRTKDSETLVLGGLDDFLGALLLEVPEQGTPSSESEHRLFPDPTGGREEQADADWRDLVRPELEEQFALNRDAVREDLQQMRKVPSGTLEVEIPRSHLPQWIHALNQARLAIDAIHDFGDRNADDEVELPGEEGLALFRLQFYGLLQEWMISRVDTL
jgi:hypothetical protein